LCTRWEKGGRKKKKKNEIKKKIALAIKESWPGIRGVDAGGHRCKRGVAEHGLEEGGTVSKREKKKKPKGALISLQKKDIVN